MASDALKEMQELCKLLEKGFPNLDIFGNPIIPKIDRSKYPHDCTRCGQPAYLGGGDVDCSNAACATRRR